MVEAQLTAVGSTRVPPLREHQIWIVTSDHNFEKGSNRARLGVAGKRAAVSAYMKRVVQLKCVGRVSEVHTVQQGSQNTAGSI